MVGEKKLAALAALIVGCLGGSVGFAQTTAFSPVVDSGSQSFDTPFGIDFNTNLSPVLVTQLGVFDNNADGVLLTDSPTQPIVIQLWDRDTGLALATVKFGGGSPTGSDTTVGLGKVFFQPLATPLTLTPSGHYYISEDFSSAEQFLNSNGKESLAPTVSDGGGLITAVGLGRASFLHNMFYNGSDGTVSDTTLATAPPATTNGFIDSGPAARYAGPNFTFGAVPEPTTLGLISIVGLGLLNRRRASSRP